MPKTSLSQRWSPVHAEASQASTELTSSRGSSHRWSKPKDPAKSQRTLEDKNHFRYKYPPKGMHSVGGLWRLSLKLSRSIQEHQRRSRRSSELEARERKSNHIKSKTNHKIVRVVVCLSQRTVRDVSDSFLIAKSVRLLVRLKGVLLVRLRTDA